MPGSTVTRWPVRWRWPRVCAPGPATVSTTSSRRSTSWPSSWATSRGRASSPTYPSRYGYGTRTTTVQSWGCRPTSATSGRARQCQTLTYKYKWVIYLSYSSAVYSERNYSSIITLSILKWQVSTQKQNDPTSDALRWRVTRPPRNLPRESVALIESKSRKMKSIVDMLYSWECSKVIVIHCRKEKIWHDLNRPTNTIRIRKQRDMCRFRRSNFSALATVAMAYCYYDNELQMAKMWLSNMQLRQQILWQT